jgi:hypothetical protein
MNLLSPAMHLPAVPPSGERKEEGMGSREHWRLNLPCLALRVSPSSCASSPGRKREAGACAAGEEEGRCGSGREDERADHERCRGGELYPRAGAGRCGRITLLHRAGGRSPRPACAQAASKGGRRSARRGRSGGGAPHPLLRRATRRHPPSPPAAAPSISPRLSSSPASGGRTHPRQPSAHPPLLLLGRRRRRAWARRWVRGDRPVCALAPTATRRAAPALLPFACWRHHILPSLLCTVHTMQIWFCLSNLQRLVGLSLTGDVKAKKADTHSSHPFQ